MEKTEKTLRLPALLSLLAAIALVVCVKYITPVCTGMLELASGKQVFMKCHYTAVVLAFFGILLAVNAIIAICFKQNITSGLMAIALGVCVFLVLSDAFGIGICLKPEMACHVTAPVAKVLATVEILLGLWMCVNTKKAD